MLIVSQFAYDAGKLKSLTWTLAGARGGNATGSPTYANGGPGNVLVLPYSTSALTSFTNGTSFTLYCGGVGNVNGAGSAAFGAGGYGGSPGGSGTYGAGGGGGAAVCAFTESEKKNSNNNEAANRIIELNYLKCPKMKKLPEKGAFINIFLG